MMGKHFLTRAFSIMNSRRCVNRQGYGGPVIVNSKKYQLPIIKRENPISSRFNVKTISQEKKKNGNR